MSTPEHRKESRSAVLVGSVWAVAGVTTVVVILRLVARRIRRLPFKADDYTTILGLILSIGCCVCSTVCANFGVGRHIETVTAQEQTDFFKTLYGYNQVYVATGPVIKIAVLLMYRRIFVIKSFHMITLVLMVLITGWWVGECLSGVWTCRPISGYWNPMQEPVPKCFDLKIYDIQYAVINIFFDVVILSLPLQQVRKLQMSGSQKVLFFFIFLLGSFACIAALIRLLSAILNIGDPDFTWVYTDALIWTAVEPCAGVISACLPVMRPILDFVLPKRMNPQSPEGSSSDRYDGGSKDKFDSMGVPINRQFTRLEEGNEIPLQDGAAGNNFRPQPGLTESQVGRAVTSEEEPLDSWDQLVARQRGAGAFG